MNLKTVFFILVVWLGLNFTYLLCLALDAERFQTGFVISFSYIKASSVNIFIWSLFSIILYHLIKNTIINQKHFLSVVLFFGIYLMWQPTLVIIDNYTTSFFLQKGYPTFQKIYLSTPFVSIYFNFIQYLFLFFFCYALIYHKYSYKVKIESIELQNKNTEIELRMSDMKMQALQAQLSPHFLFNSLNSISGLVRLSEKNKALNSISDLGDLLRFSVTASKSSFISLIEEIEFTYRYIQLQKVRFGNRFIYTIENNKKDCNLACPPFILQSLVENAFTHSVFLDDQNIDIKVKINVENHYLNFNVSNTISENKTYSIKSLGIAITNLRNRLTILFEKDFLIEQSKQTDTYITNVQIPLRENND